MVLSIKMFLLDLFFSDKIDLSNTQLLHW